MEESMKSAVIEVIGAGVFYLSNSISPAPPPSFFAKGNSSGNTRIFQPNPQGIG
jgi:hypothetical protein